jgi:hypothetical protein
VVIDLPMKIPGDAAETERKIDRRSAARGLAAIESRVLAEYARCRRPERLNLAPAGNIPSGAALASICQEKGPAEARPSLNRTRENRSGANSIA